MRLIVSNNADQFIELEAIFEEKTYFERLNFALKKFFIFFTLASVSVLIPVAHFILVPSFLIASIIGFKNAFKIRNRLKIIKSVACLSCQSELAIPEAFNTELSIDCAHCHQRYKVEI